MFRYPHHLARHLICILLGLSLWYAVYRYVAIQTHPFSPLDVGGGSVTNNTKNSLARIPLRWMIRECFKANCGVMFDSERLKEIGLDPMALYPFVLPRPPPKTAETMSVKTPVEPPSIFQRLINAFKKRGPPIALTNDEEEHQLETEEDEELADALSPVYDQLSLRKIWWILEVIPMMFRYQDSHDKWVSWFGYVLWLVSCVVY